MQLNLQSLTVREGTSALHLKQRLVAHNMTMSSSAGSLWTNRCLSQSAE